MKGNKSTMSTSKSIQSLTFHLKNNLDFGGSVFAGFRNSTIFNVRLKQYPKKPE